MSAAEQDDVELNAERFLDDHDDDAPIERLNLPPSSSSKSIQSNNDRTTSSATMEKQEEEFGGFEIAPKKTRRSIRGVGSNPNQNPTTATAAAANVVPSRDRDSLMYSINSAAFGSNGPWPSMDSGLLSGSFMNDSYMGGSFYFQQQNNGQSQLLVGSPSPSPGDAAVKGGHQGTAGNQDGNDENHHQGGGEQAGVPNVTGLPPYLSYWLATGPQRELSEITIQQDMAMMGYPPSNYPYPPPPPNAMMMNPNRTMNPDPNHPFNNPNPNNNPKQQPKSKLPPPPKEEEYKVYSSRWIMLLYMSLLNLLSDWTCYSVAPIALLTIKAFGDVDPESLVTVFLSANAIASAAEPAILGRLGLRRTVIFGAMLLMAGSIVKSGGLFVGGSHKEESLEEEADETWRLYVGFFLVGLSQPLYQCTPALLSASWFPENERTMATGVALNSNQLGIGCAFVFGTMLVSTEEDIVPYFGLLSIISTITFVGAALQFDDAPPTPPSDTARVIKGSLEIKIPDWFTAFGNNTTATTANNAGGGGGKDGKEAVVQAPAPASTEDPTKCTMGDIHQVEKETMTALIAAAPSPASGDEAVGENNNNKEGGNNDDENPEPTNPPAATGQSPYQMPPVGYMYHPLHAPPGVHPLHAQPHPLQQPPPQPYMMPGYGYYPPPPGPYGYPAGPAQGTKYSDSIPSFYHGYDQQGHYHNALLETTDYYHDYHYEDYEGVEPVMTQLGHQLDIDIRDDQIVQQFKACFARPGFAHCVVAFTTSGIIINTLSTFMDYLVTLEGAGREYVGIVGGTFQLLIMAASLVFGGWTDHSRKYYFMILFMLITGAFSLAVCNVNLDSDAGGDLRLNLLMVAILTGPLQPISTELGVEVVYPLSENTVLVIQQLFSNLLSAAFIPVFKMLRDVGTAPEEEAVKSMFEVPQYTFSFYMLIIIHACSTAYFATFNGKYLRYEAELEKKAKKEEAEQERLISMHEGGYGSVEHN